MITLEINVGKLISDRARLIQQVIELNQKIDNASSQSLVWYDIHKIQPKQDEYVLFRFDDDLVNDDKSDNRYAWACFYTDDGYLGYTVNGDSYSIGSAEKISWTRLP